MNQKTKMIAMILAAMLLFSLAACSTLTPPNLNKPTAAATEPIASVVTGIPTSAAPVPTDASTPVSTQEPYILEGATTTSSGLQFLDVTPGDGDVPQTGDILSLHFTASLPDGTEFANTKQYGDPITIVYLRDQILPGMDEGLALMKAGGTAKMVLPPELAFGPTGNGVVPANSQVILQVELSKVEEPPQPSTVASSDLTTTASGLKYADLATGQGEAVKAGNIVSTDYTIWVQGENKAEYVASSKGRNPLTFVQGAGDTVFPGWEEGVLGMQVGGKRQLIIPPDLGMGEAGGSSIPGNATLILEIELVDFKEQPVLSRVPDEKLTKTASGLAYYDIVSGEGATPANGQTVTVNYSGWLEDGTMFDSSVTRGEPFSFTLGNGSVIQGWEEGLVGMKVGGKRQLIVPADLAYGETGAGSTIPANATLIFDIELLDVQGP